MVISEGGFSSESVSNSPEKQVNRDTNSLATSSHGGLFYAQISSIYIGSLVFTEVSGVLNDLEFFVQ